MATLKQASGSMLTTIVVTSNAISTTIGAVAQSADLFTSYVGKMKTEQNARYKVEAAQFNKNLIREASITETKAEVELKSFADQSDYHAERLTLNLQFFEDLLAKK